MLMSEEAFLDAVKSLPIVVINVASPKVLASTYTAYAAQ